VDPKIVFFDMDHTLMNNDMDVSWKSFLIEEGLAQPSERDEAGEFYRQYLEARLDVESFLRFQLRQFRQKRPEEMQTLVERHFERYGRPKIYPEAQREVRRYQGKGIPTVMLTSTSEAIAGPVARWFRFEALLATRLVVCDGRYTGEIIPPYCYGEGKIHHALPTCQDRGLRLEEAGYYGDSDSDIPLLSAVGFPVAVNPKKNLERLAAERGWPVKRWRV